jgi:hypothetical protein
MPIAAIPAAAPVFAAVPSSALVFDIRECDALIAFSACSVWTLVRVIAVP